MSYYEWKPYVPVAARRAKATRELAKLEKKGQKAQPVVIEGRAIAKTFWGKAWCDNLEAYRDFEYRLERGRSYARSGAVLDLQIKPGIVEARVSGTTLYTLSVEIKPLARAAWEALIRECAGQINSLVELLSGKFSKGVMEILCRRPGGLFPAPGEIELCCSCPDWASMCKHVAAALYGVGNRLDREPGLLFLLRGVDQGELVAKASAAAVELPGGGGGGNRLGAEGLGALFGIELEEETPAASGARPVPGVAPVRSRATAPAARRVPARAAPMASPARLSGRELSALGKQAQRWLDRHGLSQRYLAERLGVGASSISLFINGKLPSLRGELAARIRAVIAGPPG